MQQKLTLAYSPCPNDTFLFFHLIHELQSDFLKFIEELHDVEELNKSAEIAKYDITKLSFAKYFQVMDKYILLNTGSALGQNCGPILIKKKDSSTLDPVGQSILVPGLNTTANLLLSLYLKNNFTPIPIRYDKIIPQMEQENYSLGVIIHEERFTFEKRGFEKLIDLGEWWEKETNCPIPLGAIAIKRSISKNIQNQVDKALRNSLEFAWKYPSKTKEYILKHSQSISEEVVNEHINLYVNQFTKNLGEKGRGAVQTLYRKAIESGVAKENKSLQLFLDQEI
ncbi:MAG: 1,4-dihydroxy-6-naphthoate synthase [Leptospiraceae bacterium]|nr:1,4-dihydroxy-6-naphthoate synthase [Leptospiraceae bacterium]MCK6380900.1 1,4-dihydroxy-6-naphthoate synthase [Leptospiraceae bacterium]NUM40045.1 1,4-dihydroxy-6-naphthoate synthase [Leptospiraceae bacterium]